MNHLQTKLSLLATKEHDWCLVLFISINTTIISCLPTDGAKEQSFVLPHINENLNLAALAQRGILIVKIIMTILNVQVE